MLRTTLYVVKGDPVRCHGDRRGLVPIDDVIRLVRTKNLREVDEFRFSCEVRSLTVQLDSTLCETFAEINFIPTKVYTKYVIWCSKQIHHIWKKPKQKTDKSAKGEKRP